MFFPLLCLSHLIFSLPDEGFLASFEPHRQRLLVQYDWRSDDHQKEKWKWWEMSSWSGVEGTFPKVGHGQNRHLFVLQLCPLSHLLFLHPVPACGRSRNCCAVLCSAWGENDNVLKWFFKSIPDCAYMAKSTTLALSKGKLAHSSINIMRRSRAN